MHCQNQQQRAFNLCHSARSLCHRERRGHPLLSPAPCTVASTMLRIHEDLLCLVSCWMAFVIFIFVVCVATCRSACVEVWAHFWALGLSFHQAGSGVQTAVTGLSSRHYHPLNHPADPGSYFIGVESKSEASCFLRSG